MSVLNCENNCEGWKIVYPEGLDTKTNEGSLCPVSHCSWCGSKLIDREEEIIGKVACHLCNFDMYSHRGLAEHLVEHFNITLKEPNE